MQPPPTRYAERDGVSIAYQVVGDGPIDLVMAPGFISHLDLQWTEPRYAKFLAHVASFCRLILYDKPGTGLSDPIAHVPTLEERAADIEAVMDAADSRRAAIFGLSEGGPASILLAATHPERVTSLVLCGSMPVTPFNAPDEFTPEVVTRYLDNWNEVIASTFEGWGSGEALSMLAPTQTGEGIQRFYATFARAAASPRMANAVMQSVKRIDVRAVLPSVGVPTLVLHYTEDQAVPFRCGQLLAEGIPGARLVELDGSDHAFWFGDWQRVADELQRFLTGSVSNAAPDRVLATVLFTDVIGSTERAAEMGDAGWRDVLERHDALARELVEANGGRIIKHMGDGLLATFDGPARAVRAAESLLAAVEPLGIRLRAGIHTGELERMGDDVGGMAVHIGARVGALARPGEVLVSGTVRDLVVGSNLVFSARGEQELKGVPGTWRLFALGEERAPDEAPLDAAADHMHAADRVAVAMARRAPRIMRLGAKVMTRR